ncbi:MAG TPA: reactive intermediate/imine deaminase [Lachnospiraceae bacterium]|nr:reactive intermediate/imine deaminase [Lachnospiraceae bacterium]
MTEISTKNAPAAIGPYSQAIEVNGMIYTSGMIPINPQTGELVAGTVEEQAEQAFSNLKALVEAAGSSMSCVVKTVVYIKNMDDFAKINAVYEKYFVKPYPARSCVEVARLPKDVALEVEAVVKKNK